MKPFVKRSVELKKMELMGEGVSDAEFLRIAGERASRPHSAVLLSGGALQADEMNRYSIVGWAPFLVFQSKGNTCRIADFRDSTTIEGDPLDLLDGLIDSLKPGFDGVVRPFCGGAMGYFAYDLKNSIERLPQTASDDLGLPDVHLAWPSRIIVHDRAAGRLHGLTLAVDGSSGACSGPSEPPPAGRIHAGLSLYVESPESNFTHEEYLRAVQRVREYILSGDVYQVNLSQRFKFAFRGDPFRLWESLFAMNPAPFYAYVDAGSHQALSTSMERFLMRRGDYIETRPIKGTRRRGATPEEDEALSRELLASPKDDAELSMIVDLLRNDLGRVCAPRSVRVVRHKYLESYQNVHHLISLVTGLLRTGTTYGEILKATFPGGSITGCPKIRAMEIIDEIEPCVRHIYTGAIGYLGFHKNMDLNIAIRTALIYGSSGYYSVGGGIVFDSVEEDEYRETLQKGLTLFQLMEKIMRESC